MLYCSSFHCLLSVVLQFGSFKLPQNPLPSWFDIMKKYKWERALIVDGKNQTSGYLIYDQEIAIFSDIANELVELWKPSNITTMNLKTVQSKISRLVKTYKFLEKDYAKKASKNKNWKNDTLKEPGKSLEKFKKLFDIAECQSTDPKSTQKIQSALKTKRKSNDFENNEVKKPKIRCIELQAQVQLEFSNSSDDDPKLDLSPVFPSEGKSSNNPDPWLSDDSSASPKVKPSNKPNPWLSDSSDSEKSRYERYQIENLDELPKTIQTSRRYGLSLQATADVINSFLEDQNDNCLKNGKQKMHDNSVDD